MLNFFSPQSGSLKNDFLSGVTVSLALVPEAIAFAFVAGVSPLIGLYSAFFIGLITALFGGRPGMISGATGAMAVVVVSLVSMHGIEYLFPTVILCGLLQIAIGLGRLGKLIRMVPHSVMLGFVNGLAIVIGLAQVNSFQTIRDGELGFVQGTQLLLMLGLVGLTMAIIWLLPKITRAVPASLVAILSVTLIAFVINSDEPSEMNVVATVGDMLKTNSIAATHTTPESTAKENISTTQPQTTTGALLVTKRHASESSVTSSTRSHNGRHKTKTTTKNILNSKQTLQTAKPIKWLEFLNTSVTSQSNSSIPVQRKIIQILTDNNRQDERSKVEPELVSFLQELMKKIDHPKVTTEKVRFSSLQIFRSNSLKQSLKSIIPKSSSSLFF